MIVQNVGTIRQLILPLLSIAMMSNQLTKCSVSQRLGCSSKRFEDMQVSVVGVGMRSHAGVTSQMFETLAAEGINIQVISI